MESIRDTLSTCSELKPPYLIIDDLKWKYLVRSVYRAKNILLLGPTGCGKTLVAQSLAKIFRTESEYFYFNLGATQDARSSLIGNMHFNRDEGTVFYESSFINAITTPNAIILLDEISRAHHDCVNILMTVLDDSQRYLRVDEKKDSSIIHVAEGVTFIATANVGNEYTATRVMDRALLSRFPVKLEMEPMNSGDEFNYLVNRFVILDENQTNILKDLCDIAHHTRIIYKDEDSKITNFIPTRTTVEMAELVVDGFTFEEILNMTVYPCFSDEGGIESERVYVKQLVQKYTDDDQDPDDIPF